MKRPTPKESTAFLEAHKTGEIKASFAEHAQQVQREADRMRRLVEHWCPANLLDEGYPNILLRAFMQATACCADQKRKLDGLEPIRPLESYPDPMQGFHNCPTGFKD